MNRKQRRAQKNKQNSPAPVVKQSDAQLEALYQKGLGLMYKNDYLGAAEVFTNIMQTKADHLPAVEQMAVCAHKLGNHETALNFFRALKNVAPQNNAKWDAYIAGIYSDQGDYDKAIELLEGCVHTIDKAEIYSALATAYFHAGQFENGLKYQAKAIEKDPQNFIYLYYYTSRLKPNSIRQDQYFLKLQELEQKAENLSSDQRLYVYFSLAEAYQKLGEYSQSFQYATKGGTEKQRALQYDSEVSHKISEQIQKYFSKSSFENADKNDMPESEAAVFIVSMPRSGTTLAEQILSAHPDVESLGEDGTLHQLVGDRSQCPENEGVQYPFGQNRPDLKKMSLPEIGQHYLEDIQNRAPGKKRFINKAMGFDKMLGAVKHALPNAKIIHVKRNPLDSCLSSYSKLFGGNRQPYSYSLTHMAERYKEHIQLMEHWKSLFPGEILEVEYEDLVENTEKEARRMLDFIGMEWDPICLKYYEQKSIVKTASLEQVRRPIYTSSLERWKLYGPEIKPLIEALGDCAPQDALDFLQKEDSEVDKRIKL